MRLLKRYFLYRNLLILIFLLAAESAESQPVTYYNASGGIQPELAKQDTLKGNQSLYTGKVWTNMYRRIEGDQFLFVSYFLPGSVSAKDKTYNNLLIRYDIFSDEIMIPVNREEIIQLNKEIIDSFSVKFENKVYRFINIRNDSLYDVRNFDGYFNVLYKQGSALYLKYQKEISPDVIEKRDGEFIQTNKIYVVTNGVVYPVKTKKDLYNALDPKKEQIRDFVKNNKLKISSKKPESFIPVVRFYDNIGQ